MSFHDESPSSSYSMDDDDGSINIDNKDLTDTDGK